MSEFKKGDWIIRKWKVDLDLDIARIKYIDIGDKLYADKYYRIYATGGYRDFSSETEPTTLKDRRMEFDWRLMTNEEKEKYLNLLGETFEPEPKAFSPEEIDRLAREAYDKLPPDHTARTDGFGHITFMEGVKKGIEIALNMLKSGNNE